MIFNEAAIDGPLIAYPLTAQTTAAAGVMRCQLRLYSFDDELLISPGFSLLISQAVYNEGDIVDSHDEVSALTALVTETNELIHSVRQSLTNGDFTPSFSVGSVATLPAGRMAAVELAGTKEAPILNFSIPQGPQGQAETVIPDTALSLNSTQPVQNAVITAALNEKLDKSEFELSSETFVKNEEFSEALSNFVEKEEIGNYLELKVDKVSGLGLSSNDFSDAEKQKLSGIAENANNYTLPALGVGTGHLANSAVTAAKIAPGAVTKSITLTLAAADWADNSQTIAAAGVTADNTLIVSPAPDSFEAYTEAAVRATAQGADSISFRCSDTPAETLTVNVSIISK